jgi:outer membrane protein TolC
MIQLMSLATVAMLLGSFLPVAAAEAPAVPSITITNNIYVIGLMETLRLAGARNLDVQIAGQRLAEAKANYQSSLWQFFPWLSPGVAYRRHDDLIQNVEGRILDVHKDSYTVGPALAAQIDLGDAIYKNLASRQLLKASDFALESQRQDAILAAAQAYFDLVKADASVAASTTALALSSNYSAQVEQAVQAGIAFKGDLLRIRVQTDRYLLTLRQAQEQVRLSAARLALLLHLDPLVELSASEPDLLPLSLVSTNATLDALVAKALGWRPELKQSHSLTEAARQTRRGATLGPLIPTVGAQVFVGGLGGGKDGDPSTFGASEDYQLTFAWRIGPGGLFDAGRIHASEAHLQIARLAESKLQDELSRQVIESLTRVHSLNDQLATLQRALQGSEETARLSDQRKEFAIGAVLETIQAQQELTRVRLDLINVIAEQNKAQYALMRSIGGSIAADAANQIQQKKELHGQSPSR